LQPDLVLAHGHGAMAALIRVNRPLPPVIMDYPDLEQIRTRRNIAHDSRQSAAWRGVAQGWLARCADRTAARRADLALVCSDHDRQILSRMAPSARIAVVPNTAQTGPPLAPQADPVALFIGIGRYPPNAEAIRWLVRDVWPLVRAGHGTARLLIVGEGTENVAATDTEIGIEVCGFVEDAADVYARARIALAPIRAGSGTRIKIIEAAMLRRPVVSTTVGAEGLSFRAGDEILIADTAAAFAGHITDLLRDDARCAHIAAAAYRRATADYAPDRVRTMLRIAAMSLLGEKDRGDLASPEQRACDPPATHGGA
jgi:glycosyltransferase involved in cell wall biosynthesis